MIYIYGDSHAKCNFNGLNIEHNNLYCSSITMNRIGRDNVIINLQESDKNSVICLVYGEVDCRCHVKRQINIGRDEDEIISELVDKYFLTINNNIKQYKAIIVVGVIPPREQQEYEKLHGPITHEFPFIGTDEERIRYTDKVNKLLEEYCEEYNYIYFNPYSYYKNEKKCLTTEYSDTNVHLKNNSYFLEQFDILYKNKINSIKNDLK